MKYTFSLLLFFLLLIASFTVRSANTSVKVNYTGSIKGQTCPVSSDVQNVNLGIWFLEGKGSNFPRNSVTDWVNFELVFRCLSGYRHISGALEGTPAKLDRKLFELDDTDISAKGMAIQVESYSPERKRWEALNANEVHYLVSVAGTVAGDNIIQLRARYKQLANEATPGNANASITFVVRSN